MNGHYYFSCVLHKKSMSRLTKIHRLKIVSPFNANSSDGPIADVLKSLLGEYID